MVILTMVSSLHALAQDDGTSPTQLIAWIGIPLFLAFCGAVFGIIKGSIRFAQYMAKSEEAQTSTAHSNEEINRKLDGFIDKTNAHLNEHDQEIAVLKFAQDRRNGATPTRKISEARHSE